MTFKLACGDVMPGCSARFENTDKNQMLSEVAAHAAAARHHRDHPRGLPGSWTATSSTPARHLLR